MGLPGTLTRNNLGFSIPSDGPLYPSLPYHYQNASLLVFEYETDGKLAAQLLPAQAELTDPPIAGLVFADYPTCTLGPYKEAVVYLQAMYKGPGAPQNAPLLYATHLYVTTDVAMAAGREIAGFPKKIAAIEYQDGPKISASLERPKGQPLASASFEPKGEPISVPESSMTYLTLRMMPSPTKSASPSICELLTTDWVMRNSKVWVTGGAEFKITGSTANDPLNLFPILRVTSSKLIRGDLEVAANDRDRSQPF